MWYLIARGTLLQEEDIRAKRPPSAQLTTDVVLPQKQNIPGPNVLYQLIHLDKQASK